MAGSAIAVVVLAAAALSLLAAGAAPGGVPTAEAAKCKDARLGSRTLKVGKCGEDAHALNWFMRAKQHEVKTDDRFRKKTRKAVRNFQKSTGLAVDGIVGKQTVKKMKKKMKRHPSSWYGPGFWGNRTACGKKLKKKTVGVAVPADKIKKFPCGTKVLLNHGGKWVRTKVIDTGGFGKYGRKWDLTRKTAKRLNKNFKRDGVFEVRWVVRK